jgi:hypothetical protein
MQLGAMPPKASSSPIGASDLDFSPLEDRLKSIEQKQMIIIVALIIIAFLILNKK